MLFQIYYLFLSIFGPLDWILHNNRFMNVVIQIVNMLKNPLMFGTIVANIIQKSITMVIMLISVPGSNCYGIGYRIGAWERFVFSI